MVGYLDPKPLSLSVDVTISLGFVEQAVKFFYLYNQNKSAFPGKKTFFFKVSK